MSVGELEDRKKESEKNSIVLDELKDKLNTVNAMYELVSTFRSSALVNGPAALEKNLHLYL